MSRPFADPPNMHRFARAFGWVAAASILIAAGGCGRPYDMSLTGIASWDKTTKAARKDGKPVLLVVEAAWCGACRVMASEMDHPAVNRLLDRVHPYFLDYDAPGTQKLRSRFYPGGGVPATLLISPEGRLLGRWTGWPGAEAYAVQVRRRIPSGQSQ
ncbi:MAG: thioredoxin family protein [Fimbriimonadaceae bacterium]|nr:thioredoxin family protein [Fimbriimonadaceae bacterium]